MESEMIMIINGKVRVPDACLPVFPAHSMPSSSAANLHGNFHTI